MDDNLLSYFVINLFVLLVKAPIMYICNKIYKYSDYIVTFRYVILVNFIIFILNRRIDSEIIYTINLIYLINFLTFIRRPNRLFIVLTYIFEPLRKRKVLTFQKKQ